jgi:hypothetical protein
MSQRNNQKHLRPDGKLRKGYRYGSGGEVIKSKSRVCKEKASRKIGLTMSEFKKGNANIKSKQQAIAVGFKMTIKENPQCKKDLRK